MSGQLIELIIFAGIAFFIINKLISTLGSTSEEDVSKRGGSFFGEQKWLKDVTGSAKEGKLIRPVFNKSKRAENLKGFIVEENKEDIAEGLAEVTERLPSFNIQNFLKSAKSAFQMIINSGTSGDDELEELVDKRYIENFRSIAPSYGKYKATASGLSAEVSEIYMFGNNIFVKVLFAGKGITDKIKELHEEWTFTKSVLSSTPAWHLTNIDRPQ